LGLGETGLGEMGRTMFSIRVLWNLARVLSVARKVSTELNRETATNQHLGPL